MNTDKYQEKLKNLREAILKIKKVKIWVEDTPSTDGRIVNPYEILEDSKMIDFVFIFNENRNEFTQTRIDLITKIEILEDTFEKKADWSSKIDLTKYSILRE